MDAGEADRLLEVIGDRITSGQTGAVWQRRTLAALEGKAGREQAVGELLERYLDLQAPASRSTPGPCKAEDSVGARSADRAPMRVVRGR